MTKRRRNKPVIAIDGPVGSGKSTTARLAAQKLGFLFVDTGAMYRALALKALREELNIRNSDAVEELLKKTDIGLKWEGNTLVTFLDGKDVSKEIRTREVTHAASVVSEHPSVREVLVSMQRKMGENGGVVMEGRDIASVVFPDAEVKIYLDADIEERVKRRHKEMLKKGEHISVESLRDDIIQRDRMNIERDIAPLIKLPDAVIIDTTGYTIEQQVDHVVRLAKEATHEAV